MIRREKLVKTKFKIFCLFLIMSLCSYANNSDSELTVGSLSLALVATWFIAFVTIVILLLSRRKYKKAGLTLEQENINLEEKIEKLKKDLKDEQEKVLEVEKMDLLEAIREKEKFNLEIGKLLIKKDELSQEVASATYELNERRAMLEAVNDELNMESFGLYKSKYDFANSSQYKFKLEEIRKKQKEMIKTKKAVHYFENWTVDGSASKGRKMTNDNIKMILRSFNSDCEAAINKIKFNNLERIENRIYKSFEQLNKLNEINKVSISQEFLNLKFDELHLGYEYEQKRELEKELLREEREKEKENKKVLQEIEKKKRSINKEILHYENAADELENKILIANDSEKIELENKLSEIREIIEKYNDEKEELDYRLENIGAGYVYIISNIGAFGENVFKIGVTRRLEPLERIRELSSASVPFKFDVHALIFSYQAFELEKELHNYFDSKRVNMVNNRKEFFNITINEIEDVLNKYKDLTFEFNKIPDAEEYRKTLKLRNQ